MKMIHPLFGWAGFLLVTVSFYAGSSVQYRVLESRVLYNGELGVSLPCVAQAKNGDLLVQFNTGKDCWPGSTAYLLRSSDRGSTWSPPQKLIESKRPGGAIHTNVGLTVLRNGDLILPFIDAKLQAGGAGFPQPRHPGHDIGLAHVIISRDDGHTWSDWIPAHAGLRFTAPHGRIVELSDGTLLLPLWAKDDAQGSEVDAGYVSSSDGGKSWGNFRRLGPFGEVALLLLPDQKTLLACLKQHPSRLTHIMRSSDQGATWSKPVSFGVQGKNAVFHLSPSGIPLLLCSPVEEGENRPGYVFYSLDRGMTWKEGVRLKEPISGRWAMAYGLSAVNLDQSRMLVTFFGIDPTKTEKGDSPWTSTTSYLGANIIEEKATGGALQTRSSSDAADLHVVEASPVIE